MGQNFKLRKEGNYLLNGCNLCGRLLSKEQIFFGEVVTARLKKVNRL